MSRSKIWDGSKVGSFQVERLGVLRRVNFIEVSNLKEIAGFLAVDPARNEITTLITTHKTFEKTPVKMPQNLQVEGIENPLTSLNEFVAIPAQVMQILNPVVMVKYIVCLRMLSVKRNKWELPYNIVDSVRAEFAAYVRRMTTAWVDGAEKQCPTDMYLYSRILSIHQMIASDIVLDRNVTLATVIRQNTLEGLTVPSVYHAASTVALNEFWHFFDVQGEGYDSGNEEEAQPPEEPIDLTGSPPPVNRRVRELSYSTPPVTRSGLDGSVFVRT